MSGRLERTRCRSQSTRQLSKRCHASTFNATAPATVSGTPGAAGIARQACQSCGASIPTGTERGTTAGGVEVRNVALPVLKEPYAVYPIPIPP